MCHPFKASKVYNLSLHSIEVMNSLLTDTTLDGDKNGGQLDAFRHAYWMAIITKKYGPRFALRLGKVHEKGNYQMFKKSKNEDGTIPDYESSAMDFLNNDVGIEVGLKYKELSNEEIKEKIIELIKEGKLFIIKKDKQGNYLTCDDNILHISQKLWVSGKCIVSSNTLRK
ncbi:MAG: hypothetical protein N2449_06980 [Bacteroidales bacterium]|nr:hypothetical protein [Bacteroidales bacterium]